MSSLHPTDLEAELERHLTEYLSPGDPLPSERELVERYGVSRHSVRTALQRLASRGIISSRPGARSRVNTPSQAAAIAGQFLSRTRATVDELYEARAVVETGAVAVLASRVADGTMPVEKLSELSEILAKLDELASAHDPAAPTNLVAALHRRDLDLDFHFGLVELVGNTMATGAEYSILQPLRSYPTLWGEPSAAANWQAEHRAILEAVAAGDMARAPQFVLHHLEQGRRRLTEALTGVPAGVPVEKQVPSRRPSASDERPKK